MTPFEELELFDEDEISPSDLIELYKELIRIVEKEIDNLSTIKQGVTPWSLLTGIGAVFLTLLGIGKGILTADPVIVGRSLIFSYFSLELVNMLISTFDINSTVKSKRVYFPRERLGYYGPLVFRWLVYLLVVGIASRYWDSLRSDYLAIAGLVFVALSYLLMSLPLILNTLVGNHPRFEKVTPFFAAFSNLGFVLTVIASFAYLPWPTEEIATSFAVGGLFAVLLWLVSLYTSIMAPNPLVKRLNDLKDDIIFRRKGLNEGLLELRRIREGNTFIETLSDEIDILVAKSSEKYEQFNSARRLLDSINALLPSTGADLIARKAGLNAILPIYEVYQITRRNISRVKIEVDAAIEKLNTKAIKVHKASGDDESPKKVDAYFNEIHRQMNGEIEEWQARDRELESQIRILKESIQEK